MNCLYQFGSSNYFDIIVKSHKLDGDFKDIFDSLVYLRQIGLPNRVHATSRLLAYSLEYTLHAERCASIVVHVNKNGIGS